MNMKRRTLSLLIEGAAVALALEFNIVRAEEYGSGPETLPNSSTPQAPQQQNQQTPQSSPPSEQQVQSPPQPLGYGSPRPAERKTRPSDG